MEPISAHSSAVPAGVREPSGIQAPRQDQPRTAPAADRYIPEEPHVPSGLYWIGKDAGGSPKIFFDSPDTGDPAEPPETQEAPPPERSEKPASGGRAEQCTCSTDKVDREIEQLKKQREQLERQLRSAPDGAKAAELERKLAQIENQLRPKDNDAYRRQHAEFS